MPVAPDHGRHRARPGDRHDRGLDLLPARDDPRRVLEGGPVRGGIGRRAGVPALQPDVPCRADSVPGRGERKLVTRVATTGSGWCAEQTGTVTGQPASTFSYSVRPCGKPPAGVACPPIASSLPPSSIEVVSTGTVGGVSRRVDVIARSSSGRSRSSATPTSSASTPSDPGQRERLRGRRHQRRYLAREGHAADLRLRRRRPGPGLHRAGTSSCPATQDTTSLPPVNQGDVATSNDNSRFFTLDPLTPVVPRGPVLDRAPPDQRRQLTLKSNRTLTLGGAVYSLCKLTIESNANLYVRAGARVLIYFDDPANCPGLVPTSGVYSQLEMSANARMTVTGSTPGHLGMLFVGSETLATAATLSSNTTDRAGVRAGLRRLCAPHRNQPLLEHLLLRRDGGQNRPRRSNSVTNASSIASDFQLPDSVAPHYTAENFVECTGTVDAPRRRTASAEERVMRIADTASGEAGVTLPEVLIGILLTLIIGGSSMAFLTTAVAATRSAASGPRTSRGRGRSPSGSAASCARGRAWQPRRRRP